MRHYFRERVSETYVIKQALRYVRQLYGHTPARNFGPLALKAVRQKLIEHRIVRIIKVTDPDTGEVREEEKCKGGKRKSIRIGNSGEKPVLRN